MRRYRAKMANGMAIGAKNCQICLAIICSLKVAMVNYKDSWLNIIPAILTFGYKSPAFNPLTIAINSRFVFTHQQSSASLVTHRVVVNGSRWWSLKCLAANNARECYASPTLHGFVVTLTRAVSGCLGAKINYAKRFSALVTDSFNTLIDIMVHPKALTRTILKRCPSVSRNVNLFPTLYAWNPFGGGV